MLSSINEALTRGIGSGHKTVAAANPHMAFIIGKM